MTPNLEKIVRAYLWVILLLLCVGAFNSVLRQGHKSFRGDALDHNYTAWMPNDIGVLRDWVDVHRQPLFEYAVRRYVWFPIWGVNERSFLLLGALWHVFLVLVVGLSTYRFTMGQGFKEPWGAVAGAAFATAVVTNNELLRESADGRHYTLCAALSVLWFGQACFGKRPYGWRFFLTSLLAMNTHFFFIPFVMLSSLWDRSRRTIGMLGALLGLTAIVNAPALRMFLLSPPGPAKVGTLLTGWSEGVGLWVGFWALVGVGLPVVALALLKRFREPLGAYLLLLLAVFIAYKCRSDYPFSPRYFFPLLGLGWATAVVALEYLPRGLGPQWALPLLGLLCWGAAGKMGSFLWPSSNFSGDYQLYTSLNTLKGPKVVLTFVKWEYRRPLYYLDYSRMGKGKVRVFVGDIGGATGQPQVEPSVNRFLSKGSPRTLVIETNAGKRCGVDSRRVPMGVRAASLSRGRKCLLLVEGARRLDQLSPLVEPLGLGRFWNRRVALQ